MSPGCGGAGGSITRGRCVGGLGPGRLTSVDREPALSCSLLARWCRAPAVPDPGLVGEGTKAAARWERGETREGRKAAPPRDWRVRVSGEAVRATRRGSADCWWARP